MSEARRRHFVFHPPLVAVFPVLAIYSANVGLFPLNDLWRPGAIAAGIGILTWLFLSVLRRSFEKGAIIASLLLICFWAYTPVVGRLKLPGFTFWLLLLTFLLVGCWWSTRPKLPTQFLNLFSALLVILASATIVTRTHRAASEAAPIAHQTEGTTRPPDVFYILLDGYGRADQLSRVFGYDNTDFVKNLEERGFFVPAHSQSNYCQTALSLSSILNLDTVQALYPGVSPKEEERETLSNLVNRPKIVRELRARGFDTVAVGTGFPAFTFEGFDLVISRPPSVSYFETVLIEGTPVQIPENLMRSQFDQRREMLRSGFEALIDLAEPTGKPRFVFAHILAPHPPFVFLPDGSPVVGRKHFGFFDGSDYMALAGTPESYKKGYIDQLQWVNSQVIKTIDALLAPPGPKPIVLVQADHGSKLGLDQNDLSKTDLQEAFAAFAAYRIDPAVREKLSDRVTPLRAIQAVYQSVTGQEDGLAEDRSFYSGFLKPYAFTEVTQKLR